MQAPHTIELDGAALKAEAEKSHEFLTLAYYGANRGRNREITDIEQMRKAIELKHREDLDPVRWADAFKRLEEMGLGSLILGRRGNPNRFRWNYSLKAIGQAAINGTPLTAHRIVPIERAGKIVNDYYSSKASFVERPEVTAKEAPKRVEAPVKKPEAPARKPLADMLASSPVSVANTSAVASAPRMNYVYVALRPDFVFEAEVPTLTQKEADVLIAAIKRCVK